MFLSDFSVPDFGIQHKQENTQALIDGNVIGNGTLYIAESQVTWITADGTGFSLEYPKICVHAISRDLSSFPQECLFLQVDGKLIEADREIDGSSEGDNDDMPTTEIRFVPADKHSLEPIYKALSECQKLHPDPDHADSDEFGNEGEFYEGVEGVDQLTVQGQLHLQRFEHMLLQAGQGDAPSSEDINGFEQDEEAADDEQDGGQFDDADMEHQN